MTTDPRMSTEYQQLIERLELAERGSRGWKMVSFLALVIAAFALVMPWLRSQGGGATAGGRASYSVVEANRVLLRDRDGTVSGGLEVDGRGTVRLVLGRSGTSAALLEAQRDGTAHLRLRGPDGTVRAAVVGGDRPSVTLSPDGRQPAVTLTASPGAGGSIQATDASGRLRFRAP